MVAVRTSPLVLAPLPANRGAWGPYVRSDLAGASSGRLSGSCSDGGTGRHGARLFRLRIRDDPCADRKRADQSTDGSRTADLHGHTPYLADGTAGFTPLRLAGSSTSCSRRPLHRATRGPPAAATGSNPEIGRASCRERSEVVCGE